MAAARRQQAAELAAARPTSHHEMINMVHNRDYRLLGLGATSLAGFRIKDKTTLGPFIKIPELSAHLVLLSAFSKLRESVHMACEAPSEAPPYSQQQGTTPDAPSADDPSERCWTNYLTRASYRFEAYFAQIITAEHMGCEPKKVDFDTFTPSIRTNSQPASVEVPDHLLPPIDVALLWHAYLLNPLRATEDAIRLPSRAWLLDLRFPLEKLARYIQAGVYHPPSEARQFWDIWIDQPYESQYEPPPSAAATPTSLNGLMMACPRCELQSFVPFTAINWPQPVFAATTRGLADEGWGRHCLSCNQMINTDTLQGRRLTNDLVSWADDPNFRFAGDFINPAGGHRFTSSPADAFLCPALLHTTRPETVRLVRRRLPLASTPVKHVAQQANYSAKSIARECEELFIKAQPRAVQRTPMFKQRVQRRARLLFGPILDSGCIGETTLDLVAAAKRQQSFCAEMARLGWSNPARLASGEDEASLARGLVRYHKWLDLMASRPRLLCPTLDIDLCWHTHQLTPYYAKDMFTFVGRFVDHDDKIEEGVLNTAFKQTAELWKFRFNQPYSQCGCTHNTPGVIKTISRVLGGDGSLSERFRASRDRPGDLREDAFEDATHPSVHPAVAVPTDQAAFQRSQKRAAQSGRRAADGTQRADHPDPFIAGYGYVPLYPFYVPCIVAGSAAGAASCVSASCCNTLGGLQTPGGGCAGGSSGAVCGGGSGTSGCGGGSGGGGCGGGGGGGDSGGGAGGGCGSGCGGGG